MENLTGERGFRPLPRFPAVYRDISLILNRQLESAKVVEIIKREGGELVESVHIFDLYVDKKIDSSEKAMGFRISYRSIHETLDGGEVNQLHDSVIDKIRQETGGKLREG